MIHELGIRCSWNSWLYRFWTSNRRWVRMQTTGLKAKLAFIFWSSFKKTKFLHFFPNFYATDKRLPQILSVFLMFFLPSTGLNIWWTKEMYPGGLNNDSKWFANSSKWFLHNSRNRELKMYSKCAKHVSKLLDQLVKSDSGTPLQVGPNEPGLLEAGSSQNCTRWYNVVDQFLVKTMPDHKASDGPK